MQSSVFNLSIMIATWIGGMFLHDAPTADVTRIVYMSLACSIAAIIIAFFFKRALRSSAVSPANR